MLNSKFLFLLIIGIGMFFMGCDPDPQSGTVNINFEYKVGNEDLTLNSFNYESTEGYEYQVINNKYYISRINLINQENESHELAMVHLRDVHDDATKQLIIKDVPTGTYRSLSFTFGLNVADNDQSVLANTVENQNMNWPAGLTGAGLPSGYHFMKYDLKYKNADDVKSFNLHLGPTRGNNNFFTVTLPFDSEFVLDNNTVTIDLLCNLNEWLENPNTYDFESNGQFIMPFQPIQEIFKANGTSVFSVGDVVVK